MFWTLASSDGVAYMRENMSDESGNPFPALLLACAFIGAIMYYDHYKRQQKQELDKFVKKLKRQERRHSEKSDDEE